MIIELIDMTYKLSQLIVCRLSRILIKPIGFSIWGAGEG